MEITETPTAEFPKRYAAALEVIAGAPNNATAEKHGIDKGQLSRFVVYARTRCKDRLGEAELEKKFWEKVCMAVDTTDNTIYTKEVEQKAPSFTG